MLLLDVEGRVVWFADRGYSASGMVDLDARARALLARPASTTVPGDVPPPDSTDAS